MHKRDIRELVRHKQLTRNENGKMSSTLEQSELEDEREHETLNCYAFSQTDKDGDNCEISKKCKLKDKILMEGTDHSQKKIELSKTPKSRTTVIFWKDDAILNYNSNETSKAHSSVTPLHTPRNRLERAAEVSPVSTNSSRSNSIARERSRAAEDAVEMMLDRMHLETINADNEENSHPIPNENVEVSVYSDDQINFEACTDSINVNNDNIRLWIARTNADNNAHGK